MLIRKVTDIYGREVNVNEETRKLYSYNNKKSQVTYSAEIVKDGKSTGFFTDYIVSGKIMDIEERMNIWNNSVKLVYSRYVEFNASKNDPDRTIWKRLVKYVTDNQETFFTKTGYWRVKFTITTEQI